jgi:hypothetical protein
MAHTDETKDEFILLESYNSDLGKIVILDNDEHSVWAFMLDAETQEIEFDGFVCALSPPFKSEKEVEKLLEDGFSPAITAEYASALAHQPDALAKEFTADWQEDGYLFIYLGEELFLVMDLEEELSYSKSVGADGPYGMALTPEVEQDLGLGDGFEEDVE